jgi:hypothetical protein
MLLPLSRRLALALVAGATLPAAGCSSVGGQIGTLQTQNRSLLEQNRVQLAEIENLKTHSRRLEDKLIDAERQLARSERDEESQPRHLAVDDRENASLFDSPGGLNSDHTAAEPHEPVRK